MLIENRVPLPAVPPEVLHKANEDCRYGEILGRWEGVICDPLGQTYVGTLWLYEPNSSLRYYAWKLTDTTNTYTAYLGKGAAKVKLTICPILRLSGSLHDGFDSAANSLRAAMELAAYG